MNESFYQHCERQAEIDRLQAKCAKLEADFNEWYNECETARAQRDDAKRELTKIRKLLRRLPDNLFQASMSRYELMQPRSFRLGAKWLFDYFQKKLNASNTSHRKTQPEKEQASTSSTK
jgi:chromosome segregation ATPase